MTTFDRFEASIPELMTELAPARVPDYFDDLLQDTARQPQRPAWSFPERWLPVDLAARPPLTRSIPWRPLLVALATIALLLAAVLAASVGSQPRLPPPFGAAGNGVLVSTLPDRSVVTIDPITGSQTVLAPATADRGDPTPSRDGRRIAFTKDGFGPSRIVVTAVDGSQPTDLAGEYVDAGTLDWSPDSSHVAFTSTIDGTVAITVAATDGSGATTLPLDRDVRDLWYLPDGRLVIIAAGAPGQACDRDQGTGPSDCALFTVAADGTGFDPLVSGADFEGLGVYPAPDGTKVAYVEWAAGAPGRLHVVDLATKEDVSLPVTNPPAEYNINHAWFSPDGASILFDLLEVDGDHWSVIPASGGAFTRLGPKPSDGTQAAWSPDGRSVLAWYGRATGGNELWLLDAAGSGNDRRLPVDVPGLPAWQRVSAGA